MIVKDRANPKTGEQRWHAIGLLSTGAVITLAHTYKNNHEDKTTIHFISAFESTKRQIDQYFSQDLA